MAYGCQTFKLVDKHGKFLDIKDIPTRDPHVQFMSRDDVAKMLFPQLRSNPDLRYEWYQM